MLQQICELAQEAGYAIMETYNAQEPLQVEHKVIIRLLPRLILPPTMITAGLARIAPDIPNCRKKTLLNGQSGRIGNAIG